MSEMISPDMVFMTAEIDTLEEAVRALQHLDSDVRDLFKDIRTKQKELVRKRFAQGRIVSACCQKAEWGEAVVDKLSEGTGMSRRVLYEAKEFFEDPTWNGSLTELELWIADKEAQDTSVNLSYIRAYRR